MLQIRLQLGSPEAYHGSGCVGDWLRRLLSYLSYDDHRYRLIAQHYLEHAPEAATREHMVQFYDYDLQSGDPTKAAVQPALSSISCYSLRKDQPTQLLEARWVTMGSKGSECSAKNLGGPSGGR